MPPINFHRYLYRLLKFPFPHHQFSFLSSCDASPFTRHFLILFDSTYLINAQDNPNYEIFLCIFNIFFLIQFPIAHTPPKMPALH
jgi:hypothetical protein